MNDAASISKKGNGRNAAAFFLGTTFACFPGTNPFLTFVPRPRVLMSQHYRFDKENASRRPGITPLKDAIGQMLKSYQLQTRFNETYLEAFWEKMMGKAIASRTNRLYVKDRILYIEIASAPLRNELVIAKNKMIQLINKEMGTEVVDEVIFI